MSQTHILQSLLSGFTILGSMWVDDKLKYSKANPCISITIDVPPHRLSKIYNIFRNEFYLGREGFWVEANVEGDDDGEIFCYSAEELQELWDTLVNDPTYEIHYE